MTLGPFTTPGEKMCFNVTVPDNDVCTVPSVDFTIMMSPEDEDDDGVIVSVPVTTIVIDDSMEPECKCSVHVSTKCMLSYH